MPRKNKQKTINKQKKSVQHNPWIQMMKAYKGKGYNLSKLKSLYRQGK